MTQIKMAALKVFAKRGVIGAKTSLIAAEAGLSEGLIFKYFNSKQDLFITLVQNAIEESKQALTEIYQLPGSPIEKLRFLTKEILDEENQLPFLLIHHVSTDDGVPKEAKELVQQQGTTSQYVDLLEDLFKSGQQAGEIILDNPRELAASYLKVLSGLMTVVDESDEFHLPKVDLIMRMIADPQGPGYR